MRKNIYSKQPKTIYLDNDGPYHGTRYSTYCRDGKTLTAKDRSHCREKLVRCFGERRRKSNNYGIVIEISTKENPEKIGEKIINLLNVFEKNWKNGNKSTIDAIYTYPPIVSVCIYPHPYWISSVPMLSMFAAICKQTKHIRNIPKITKLNERNIDKFFSQLRLTTSIPYKHKYVKHLLLDSDKILISSIKKPTVFWKGTERWGGINGIRSFCSEKISYYQRITGKNTILGKRIDAFIRRNKKAPVRKAILKTK
ncbi:MAG: hypothetical protein KKB59_19310 [Spirochaetes bacterium]|nr:hypothetical protein [Spirochaetota bacterium]